MFRLVLFLLNIYQKIVYLINTTLPLNSPVLSKISIELIPNSIQNWVQMQDSE